MANSDRDIRKPEDREALSALKELALSVADLETYATQVRELDLPEFWLVTSPLGHISIPTGPKRHHGIELSSAVAAVNTLWSLREVPGFSHFVEGWRNGPQVQSSLAELRCVQYLASAANHREFEFGPLVSENNKERADLLWVTTDREFLVEAKSLRLMESEVVQAANRLLGEAIPVAESFRDSLQGCRLDIVCSESGANFTALLTDALSALRDDLSSSRVGAQAEQGFVKVTLQSRAIRPVSPGPSLLTAAVVVGTTPTKIHPVEESDAWITVALLLRSHVRHAISSILKKARQKLRTASRPAVIYLETDYLDAAQNYLEEMMLGEAYEGIPLVIASNGAEVRLVRRQIRNPEGDSLDAIIPVLAI